MIIPPATRNLTGGRRQAETTPAASLPSGVTVALQS
jgi:hypothetical protein